MNDLIHNLDIKGFTFASKELQANASTGGVRLGVGKCKAVKLQLPKFLFATNTANTVTKIWYGDRQQQMFELLQNSNNNNGEWIICNDVSEVFILTTSDVVINYIVAN